MWADISQKYQASSDGHIRNKRTGHVLKEFLGKDGYLRTQFDGKTQLVHRAVIKAFREQPEGKNIVNHKDGNKANNSVSNLEWCNLSENMHHAYQHSLKKRPAGTINPKAKLSIDDVTYIKKYYRPGDKKYGAKPLSKRFNVAPQTISAVTSGQNWKEE